MPATPACRAPVITSTSPATGLLCRSIVPELVNVVTPIKWPCNGPPSAIALLGLPSGRYCPVLSSVVAPVTAGSASVPLLVKLLFRPAPRSAMATRSVSRTPSPLVSAKCLRSNVPLLMMLLSPPVNCTKPVMVPLLMTCGSPATARSDSAPMLPSLVRVAVPPVELRITPAAGRAKSVLEPTPVTPACHPPITDTPCATLTATLLPGVPGSPVLIALIPVLNCPVVETLLIALTSTVPVVEAAQMPCASAPCVVIAPDDVTVMFPPGPGPGGLSVALYIVPLSATMPSASTPFVVIGPDEATVTPPLLMPGRRRCGQEQGCRCRPRPRS